MYYISRYYYIPSYSTISYYILLHTILLRTIYYNGISFLTTVGVCVDDDGLHTPPL